MGRRREGGTIELFAAPVAPIVERDVAAIADLALPVPVDRAFSYVVPTAMRDAVVPGARVLAPFGSRRLAGVVVDVRGAEGADISRLKSLFAVVDATPVLPRELLSFLREVARYYLAPLGEVLALALPAIERKAIHRLRAIGVAPPDAGRIAPSRTIRFVRPTLLAVDGVKLGPKATEVLAAIRAGSELAVEELAKSVAHAAEHVRALAKKGLVEIFEKDADVRAFSTSEPRDAPPALTDEQVVAVREIVDSLDEESPLPFLVHGVTGSGKTEVYLHAIEACLARGRGALVLVPEIALTPQLVARFRARFGDEVAVVHSALDPTARHAMWRRLHAGELRVAIGARSALFAPVPSLGLVVVDEEHDPSFKQEEGVRYQARDCAILRAHRAGAACVLGSATPSLESIELTHRGKMRLLRLANRARAQPLPAIEVIDLRRFGPGPTGSKLISLPLHRALEVTLSQKEQAILFLNRRGFAPAVLCERCGTLRRCEQCDVALTYHEKRGLRPLRDGTSVPIAAGLRCHYCDHVEPLPHACPKCNGPLALEGLGTERLEEVLAKAFPEARVGRLDRDVASGKDVEAILAKVRAREIDILVGTQMVTKGHDLPFVTLVGVVNADGALSMPDFRAAERTFQLLVQVAGRAGRGDATGRVIIQTRAPEHPAIAFAAGHDVLGFVEQELRDRKELGYPPYARLVLVRIDGPNEEQVAAVAARFERVAREREEVARDVVEVRGPSPAPMPRVRGRFRWRLLLRGPRRELRAVAAALKDVIDGRVEPKLPHAVRVALDVDPSSMT